VSEISIKTKKYDERLVEFLKSIKGRWDPSKKEWIISIDKLNELKSKIKELNLQDYVEIPETKEIKEGSITMRLSKDKKYALLRINLIAFREDIEALLKGRRSYVRFKVLPYRRKMKK
jgi:predicted RNA-binding protein